MDLKLFAITQIKWMYIDEGLKDTYWEESNASEKNMMQHPKHHKEHYG